MNQDGKNLFVAIIAGIFAAFLMYSYSQEKRAEFEKSYGPKKMVVVTKKEVLELQTLDDDLLELAEIPENFVQPGAATDIEPIVGQIASAPMKKGEQVLINKLLQPGPETGISIQVSPTKRALTIPIDETRGVAKLIRPGDRVDIITAVDSGRGTSARRDVVTLFSDVPVLATGINVVNSIPRTFEYDASSKSVTQIALTGDTKYNSVTIELTPKEAQDMVYVLATSPGNIFFTLRNPNDKSQLPRLPSSTGDAISGSFGLGAGPSYSTPAAPPIVIPNRFSPSGGGPRR